MRDPMTLNYPMTMPTVEEMNPAPEDWEIADEIFAHDHEEPTDY